MADRRCCIDPQMHSVPSSIWILPPTFISSICRGLEIHRLCPPSVFYVTFCQSRKVTVLHSPVCSCNSA
ncbi:unnamed protein product [Pleuronectes platessa]|uniref:Uncharacterized protein n=1 Tax=Pleuronectes platessa TaxID=8262 RepID=A0A9N7YZ27_PLEPL|nr:unnamed protein product [Pleuronectes platessa]